MILLRFFFLTHQATSDKQQATSQKQVVTDT